MDWLQIAGAVLLGAMFFMIMPTAKRMVKDSPKGTHSDWMSFVFPMAVVILFIMLLITLV